MRWIYLSPHLDDAVLSAGGLIYEQTQSGMPVEIWTFMCGVPSGTEYSPFAALLHARWGFSSAAETIHERREEDRRAAAIVGAAALHFDFLDCIYRRAANGEWPYYCINLPPQELDRDLPAQIASAISARLAPDDILVCQLAVGSHVDHVIVRQAAELLGRPLLYDVDVPYILDKPEELVKKAAGMKQTVHGVTEAGLKSWVEAVLEYQSQLPALGESMGDPEKTSGSLRNYWSQHRGIPLLQFV